MMITYLLKYLETNAKLCSVLQMISLTFVGWWFMKWWYTKKKCWENFNKIPGPPGLPLIGNSLQFNVEHDELYERVFALRLLWGSREGICRVWLGSKPYIFVSKAETVEPILHSNQHIEKSNDYEFLEPWLGTGLLTSSGKKWQHRRKILTPTFHFNILEDFVQVFGEQTDILVEKLTREIDKGSFDLYPYITLCTLDIICETAMGKRISAQSNSESDYVKAIYEHKECIQILHDFSNKVITERRQEINKRECSNATKSDQDFKRLAFLDLLIKASKDGPKLSNDDIREEVDTFMFEGHDTTSSAVCWTLYLLGSYPKIQEKVFMELQDIFSEGETKRRPTLKDLKKMKYLDQCIKEALRLYPSVPFLARKLSMDTQIGKYRIPRQTTAIIAIPMLHRNPEIFQNPESFEPERFASSTCLGRHPYAFIPFSAGPRNCIGQKFALLEEKAIISGILRKYEIKSTGRREDIQITAELVIRAKNGLQIKIKER